MAAVLSPWARFLGTLLAVWVTAWLPIGLWVGDWDFVLTSVSRDTPQRQLYQYLLYLGLFLTFAWSWKRHRPARPGWKRIRLFGVFFGQGLIATLILRGLLDAAGWASWSWTQESWVFAAVVLISSFAVALVEEAVFRGFLLGHLVQSFGWTRGAWLTSLLFAVVHLFRPGTPAFKVSYGVGLLLFGYLLARLAWHYDSLWASIGFHSGVIVLNIASRWDHFTPNLWSGSNVEPVAGALSWVLTLGFLGLWQRSTT